MGLHADLGRREYAEYKDLDRYRRIISMATGSIAFRFHFCFASFSDVPFSFVVFSDMPFSFISGFADVGFEDDGSIGFADLEATLGGVGW